MTVSPTATWLLPAKACRPAALSMTHEGKAVLVLDVAALPLAAPLIAAGNRCSKTLRAGQCVRAARFLATSRTGVEMESVRASRLCRNVQYGLGGVGAEGGFHLAAGTLPRRQDLLVRPVRRLFTRRCSSGVSPSALPVQHVCAGSRLRGTEIQGVE